MAVAHGTEKDAVLAHKAAIDEHLREAGIEFSYTNVFWGGRSEIKPSEIAPDAYRDFCRSTASTRVDARRTRRGRSLDLNRAFAAIVAALSAPRWFSTGCYEGRHGRRARRRAPPVDAARRLSFLRSEPIPRT